MPAVARRVILFVLLNLLVVTTLSAVTYFLGLDRAVTRQGINLPTLAGSCLVWGMGGAFISLALSRVMARRMMNVEVIDATDRSAALPPHARFLLSTVERLARQAGLPATPQVGIYQSPEINAFATGPTRARALVAVSSGLLANMDEEEATGVLAHEISHVANGDMVTMTLLQGVVNAFVMFLTRLLTWAITQAGRRDDDRGGFWMTLAVQMALQTVFMLMGSLLVAWFSRSREFRADAGAARLAGRSAMVKALQRLRANLGVEVEPAPGQAAVQSMQISSRTRGGLQALAATHPPLEERIARLREVTSPMA